MLEALAEGDAEHCFQSYVLDPSWKDDQGLGGMPLFFGL